MLIYRSDARTACQDHATPSPACTSMRMSWASPWTDTPCEAAFGRWDLWLVRAQKRFDKVVSSDAGKRGDGAAMALGGERAEVASRPQLRSAAEAGWRASRYNLYAPLPKTSSVAVANLFKGTCCTLTPIEGALLNRLDEIGEGHPIVERLARRGIICNFDERGALEALGRAACSAPFEVTLTICPTMRCNFACQYCFQDHARPWPGAHGTADAG